MSAAIFAFEVSVKGTDWVQTINARSAGRAKAAYFQELSDPWPDIPFTRLRCRKVGAAHTSPQFERNAVYRGMPGLRCGQPVRVGEARGVIVGHNASANFDVLFDVNSPRYSGLTLNVHPGDIVLEGIRP